VRRRKIGHKGVPRSAPDALSDTVDEPCRHRPPQRWCEREQWLGKRRHTVTGDREGFSFTEVVAERPGKYLRYPGRCLSDALEETDSECSGTEARDDKDRQEAMDHLR